MVCGGGKWSGEKTVLYGVFGKRHTNNGDERYE